MFAKLRAMILVGAVWFPCGAVFAAEFPKPYSPPAVERENVFAFTQKPTAKYIGSDKYKITFAVKGRCDVTVGVVDPAGKVVRHLASGVLGSNAPAPLQKNSLSQTLIWNGKDDLGEYPKEPARLRVRVMLGLKPVFDKRLGGTDPKNFPGDVWGVAVDKTGAYVFIHGGGFGHMTVRKFDRKGRYVRTVFPPPANMPRGKLAGTGFIEYEKGKRAWQGPNLYWATGADGLAFNNAATKKTAHGCQIAVAGRRLLFANAGKSIHSGVAPSMLFSLYTDGSTDIPGMKGRLFAWGCHFFPLLAASPDGKRVYMTCRTWFGDPYFGPVVVYAPADGSKRAVLFVGERRKPGSDNAHLNAPEGLDCDAQGRVYVADSRNNRLQIFSPDGKYLKTIRVSRPGLVRINRKTGAIYVQHAVRIHGKSIARLTKLASFANPKEVYHVNGISSNHMGLDYWSAKPRLWLAESFRRARYGRRVRVFKLRLYEEDGKKLRLVRDFDAEARKEAGANYMGPWAGNCFDKLVCDPTRERVYYLNSVIFDLKTGKLLGRFTPALRCRFDDAAFDKHGFMHLHFNPCFFGQGVGRVGPDRAVPAKDKKGVLAYPEVPYDYGVTKLGWLGVLPTKDQGGAKGFQDGLGVNMKGDVASECNIYYVPKMEKTGWGLIDQGMAAQRKRGEYVDSGRPNYAKYIKNIREKEKRGERVYFIKRKPGIPLAGGTIWTWNWTGELRRECAVIAGDIINGTQIDEDRAIYFVNARPKLYNGEPFLHGKGGLLGKKGRQNVFTGTLIKSKPDRPCFVVLPNAAIPMDQFPKRPPEVLATDYISSPNMVRCWVEGAAWLYAGASPITSVGCSCPRQHLGLDWYKRTYLPEGYRHSIGVLDTNGNLILHVGRYGNFDDAPGGRNGAKPGGDDLGLMLPRFLSATDNYLVFGDWGERLVVLKLAYHAEETVPIRMK